MKVDYRAIEEPEFHCEERAGELLQNRLLKLISKLGAKLDNKPWWDGGTENACINLPNNSATHSKKSFIIYITPDYFSANKLNGVIAVLHELGHLQDCKLRGGMRNMVQGGGTHNLEIVAWEKAFKLAGKIGFRDYEAIYKTAMRSLFTYYGDEEHPEAHQFDSIFNYLGEPVSWEEAQERLLRAFRNAERATRQLMYAN